MQDKTKENILPSYSHCHSFQQSSTLTFLKFLLLTLCYELSHSICQTGEFWNPLNNACVNECPWNAPNLYYADSTSNRCVLTCPSTPSRYANDLTQTCDQTCPWDEDNPSEQTYYDNNYRRCTLKCPANPSTYAYSKDHTCVTYCPSGTYSLDTNRSCVVECPSYHYSSNILNRIVNKCVAKCPSNTFAKTDNQKKYCVKAIQCPSGQFGNPLTAECVKHCPGDGTTQLFADTNPNVKLCVQVCPDGYFRQNIAGSRECVNKCGLTLYINYIENICVNINNCPAGTFAYLGDTSGQCIEQCPQPFYAITTADLSQCVTKCSENKFRDDTTRTCVNDCPPGYFADATGDGTDGNQYKCRKKCTADNEYGDTVNRLCVTKDSCPSPYVYADTQITKQCVTQCPENYYGDETNNICATQCPWGTQQTEQYYKDFSTRKCVKQCPVNPSLYKDKDKRQCVSVCDGDNYAVESSRQCQSQCPTGFYKQVKTKKCVSDCPIDPVPTFFYKGYKDDGTTPDFKCVEKCLGDTFADQTTMSCIDSPCPSQPSLFGYQNKCIAKCPDDKFAHPQDRVCADECTGQYFEDSSTKRCVKICPTNPNLFANLNTNKCVEQCDNGKFSDNSTRECVDTCNQSVGYLAYKPLKMCVLVCLNETYAHQGECVDKCPNDSTPVYYIDKTTKSCVQNCPDYYFMDDLLGECVQLGGCSTGYYADYTQRKCVQKCNSNKFLYKSYNSDNNFMQCVSQCPYGLFGDYSDSENKHCAVDCPNDWFADDSTWTCVKKCPQKPSYYGDFASKECMPKCREELGLYAYDTDRMCVDKCPADQFADNFTRRCLPKCLLQPNTYEYVSGDERVCLLQCPIGFYADNSTRKCVDTCPENPNYFAHNESRTCVSVCPATDTSYYYADNQSRACVKSCPFDSQKEQYKSYRDSILRICMPKCSDLQYADPSTGDCVEICPWEPQLFGQLREKICVQDCDPSQNIYAENETRTCVKTCPAGTYADNLTQKCVVICPESQLTYGDSSTHKCVKKCPDTPSKTYADNSTDTCVNICPNQTYGTPETRVCQLATDCPDNYFADPFTKLCVDVCPATQKLYAENDSQSCLPECPGNLFADNDTYKCVKVCPKSPSYYGYSNKCVQSCPQNLYADDNSRLCVPSIDCSNTISDNQPTYGDPSSLRCVTKCPFNYYADTRTDKKVCVKMCDQGLYADDQSKHCVGKCPQTNKTYGNNQTNKCVEVCPFEEFAQNGTRMCMSSCPDPSFADYNVRVCVEKCSATPNLYGDAQNHVCVQQCPESFFADDSTRLCVPECPEADPTKQTFADRLTQRCVLSCPVAGNGLQGDEFQATYADPQTFTCQSICTYNDNFHSYADNSTLKCVKQCPSNPEYYADDSTKTCVYICPSDTQPKTFSDNTSRVCSPTCNETAFYFSDYTLGRCVLSCPGGYFADSQSRTCVKKCPYKVDEDDSSKNVDTFGDQSDRTCKPQCQQGWFGQNSSRLCVQYCPINEFANVHTRRCVQKCDGQLPELADRSTNKCVTECPEVPDLFADWQKFQCVAKCPSNFWASNVSVTGNGVSRECVQKCAVKQQGADKLYYFADKHTGRCVINCPSNLFTYADKLTQMCVQKCPDEGINNKRTFADDSTKQCVEQCPQAPWTYADKSTNKCVFRCPEHSFGENTTQQCVQSCQQWKTFAENTTNFCVSECPSDSFAENNTFICVQKCPRGSYADNSTWICVKKCPQNPALYADLDSQVCVVNCPDNRYGDDLTRTCVTECPTNPVYYAYEPSNRCYRDCIYPYFGQFVRMVNGQVVEITDSEPGNLGRCVLTCSWGEYRNLTTHRCESCLEQCTSCQSLLNCETCINSHFLFNGTCLSGCQLGTNPCVSKCPVNYITGMITYASQSSRSCVQTCPVSTYGLNSTLHCVSTCPASYYPSKSSQRCELCINGCNDCSNLTYCYGCYDGYLFANNLCTRQCSSTLAYYYEGACVAECIAGTYLMSDRVSCNNCSAACATCSLIATNCTKCVGAYLYNYNCVSKCPSGYYPNSDLLCVVCTASTPQCNVSPLTYTLESFSQSGALYVLLTFNREVSIDLSQIKQIISLTLSGVPSTSYSWTASKVSPSTYRLDIKAFVSLNERSVTVNFLKPDFVIDPLKTVLQSTKKESPLPSYDYISAEAQKQSQSVSAFGSVMSYVALAVLLILLFKGAYPLLLVIEVFQHIYFHFFLIEQLPYNFSNFLINLRWLNFQFLPNVFDSVVGQDHESGVTPTKFKQAIGETTFMVSAGHYILLIVFYALWAILVSLLKNRSINKYTKLRRICKQTFTKRIRFGAINECLWFCFLTFLVFGLWQFRALSSSSSNQANDQSSAQNWFIANICLAIAGVAACLFIAGWNIYLSLAYRQRIADNNLPNKYAFVLGDEKSVIPFEMPLRYVRKTLFAILIFSAMIELQLVALIAVNCMVLSFYSFYRPSKSTLTNWVNIGIQLCYVGLQVTILLYINSVGLETDQKLVYGQAMLGFGVTALLLVLMWMVWQFMIFLYDFKFVRDIVEETKLANQIHPDQDNLKVDLERDYQKDEMIEHEQELTIRTRNQEDSIERSEREDDDQSVHGIQKAAYAPPLSQQNNQPVHPYHKTTGKWFQPAGSKKQQPKKDKLGSSYKGLLVKEYSEEFRSHKNQDGDQDNQVYYDYDGQNDQGSEVQINDTSKNKKNKDSRRNSRRNKQDKLQKQRQEISSEGSARIGGGQKGSSRLLFGDLNIEDLQ